MGCGVSKTSATSPISEVDVCSEPRQSPIPSQTPVVEEPLIIQTEQKEPMSLKSFSQKSIDSDAKSTSTTEDESADGQSSPIQVKAQGEDPVKPSPSHTAVETKKGFVAFEVPLNDEKEATLDSVLRKPLPKRLRHLEPLGHAPQITTEKLMEKLEKAEEKRQRVLARYKEQSSRRKEIVMRRNEQMGDVFSSAQPYEDVPDSDQKAAETCEVGKCFVSGTTDLPTNFCDENVNWNEPELRNSPPAVTDTSEGSSESIDKNNNNLEARFSNSSNADPCHDGASYMPSFSVEHYTLKPLNSRYGSYLQAVQEEDELDTMTSSSEDISSGEFLAYIDSSAQSNNNNNNNNKNNNQHYKSDNSTCSCFKPSHKRTKYRSKGSHTF